MATELSPTAKKLMQAMTQTAPAQVERPTETNLSQPYMDAISQQAANDALAAQNAVTPADNSQTTKQTITVSENQPASTQAKPMSYAEMFVAMNPYRPQTAEERAEQAKRNRRNALFAALSDGISALSNLYYTTKGAPNSFNGGNTLSGKLYERQRQLMKDQEARDKDYLNGYLRALEMDRNREASDRNYRLQLENTIYNHKRQAERDAESARRWNQQQTDAKAKQEAQQRQWDRNYEESVRHHKATEAASYARANGGGGSGSSSEKLWIYPIKGEDIELPKTFWSNAGEVNGLYSMLPQDIRDKIEHEYTQTGRVKKDIKPTLEQKRQAIMDNATTAMMEKLRKKSRSFGGTVSQSQATVPDDPYADYEISAPSVDEDEELDFDSMIMN